MPPRKLRIRVASRPLDEAPIKVGALRHDAIFVQDGDETYIMERLGPLGSTNDVKRWKSKVHTLEPELLNSDKAVAAYREKTNNAAGLSGPPVYVPGAPGPGYLYVPKPNSVSICLENTETGKSRLWDVRLDSFDVPEGVTCQDIFNRMTEHGRMNPYDSNKKNCQHMVQFILKELELQGPDPSILDAGMYAIYGLGTSIDSPSLTPSHNVQA